MYNFLIMGLVTLNTLINFLFKMFQAWIFFTCLTQAPLTIYQTDLIVLTHNAWSLINLLFPHLLWLLSQSLFFKLSALINLLHMLMVILDSFPIKLPWKINNFLFMFLNGYIQFVCSSFTFFFGLLLSFLPFDLIFIFTFQHLLQLLCVFLVNLFLALPIK